MRASIQASVATGLPSALATCTTSVTGVTGVAGVAGVAATSRGVLAMSHALPRRRSPLIQATPAKRATSSMISGPL